MIPIESISLDEIRAAQERTAGLIVRTPLLPLNVEDAPAEIYLKLENLQPIGSFKIRGMGNAVLAADREQLQKGVWTASAGNAAQGVAWAARRLGLPCTIIVPERAAKTKLAAIRRLGGHVVETSYDSWWQTFHSHEFEGQDGLFVHPFADPVVMAGNGTIGLEILEDLPDVDAVRSLLEQVLGIFLRGDRKEAGKFIDRYSAWRDDLHGRLAEKMRAAETYRYVLVRYAALGE